MNEHDAQTQALQQWATIGQMADLRDRFAMAALAAMTDMVGDRNMPASSIAAAAFHIADAMLAERAKPK